MMTVPARTQSRERDGGRGRIAPKWKRRVEAKGDA
jgi:hypothetical protein